MATSLRLSPFLQQRAESYADRIGVSVAALVSVALADYLAQHDETGGGSPDPAPVPPSPISSDELEDRFGSLPPAERLLEKKRLARLESAKGRR